MTNSAYRYPLALNTFARDEIESAKEVLESGRLTMGERVRSFEQEFAAWIGAKHALMVNSGSSANLLIIDALLRRSKTAPLLKPGDEVIVPALAWPTTVWPLIQLGLVPVFVDVEPESLAIDLKSVQMVLTPKTKAIFLIHVLGRAAPMDRINSFCKQNGLQLIEDVCESLGAHHQAVHAGNFGLMSSFSLYLSHHISTMEGGLVCTSDDQLYDDLKSLRSHGWLRDRSDRNEWAAQYPDIDPRFLFVMAGYNVRPMEIQGAIGSVQLRKLDAMLVAREKLARRVQDWIAKYTPWMRLIGSETLIAEGASKTRRQRAHSWMTLPLELRPDAPCARSETIRIFEEAGVETRPIIAGNLARHPAALAYRTRQAQSLKTCDEILARGFMIGCHPLLAEEDVSALESAFKKASQVVHA